MPLPAPRTASLLLSLGRPRPPPHQTRLLLFPRAVRLSTSAGPQTATTAYKYHAAACVSAKTDRLDLPRNTYEHARRDDGAKPRPVLRGGGHDAFFVSDAATGAGDAAPGGSGARGALAFGVADGVGGWVDSGVNPADFSQRLCRYMARAAAAGVLSAPEEDKDADDEGEVEAGTGLRGGKRRQRKRLLHPVELLGEGYARVLADNGVFAGGSTACVATASRDGVLEVANLGDSGYVHISPFRLSHLSAPQTHSFNAPFQLSKIPPRMRMQMNLFGAGFGSKHDGHGVGAHYEEQPQDADVYAHAVAHGDVVVLATDGVWDNLSAQDVLRAVSGVMVRRRAWVAPQDGDGDGDGGTLAGAVVAPGFSRAAAEHEAGLAAVIAAEIVREAKMASLSGRRDGPFAKEVQRLFPWEGYRGGKPDDICAVVVVVTRDNET